MKTLILPLIFSALFFASSTSEASQDGCCTDSIKSAKTSLLVASDVTEEEAAPDLEAPFWFQEKVYIHIYDQNDKPLVDGAFTSKDLKENKELRDLLRKSTRFLSLDSHHYYMLDEE